MTRENIPERGFVIAGGMEPHGIVSHIQNTGKFMPIGVRWGLSAQYFIHVFCRRSRPELCHVSLVRYPLGRGFMIGAVARRKNVG